MIVDDVGAIIQFIATSGEPAKAGGMGSEGLSVPAGFSKSLLPVGFQLVGRPFAEAALFRIAAAYERETGWPEHMPSLPK
jgi:aspartyl-tRNA(Asn)/glutamyl-tRNA(Gln) amidotransferase subunit A